MVGLFGDDLVSDVLFCGGDSFEEDLRWGSTLGVFVDLVMFDDEANDGVALLKIVEALSCTLFFSTSVELQTKGVGGGGGGAGREMIDSNTCLPSIFTPKHF